MDPRRLEQALAQDLRQAIAELPGFSAKASRASGHDPGYDFDLQVDGPAPARLQVECKVASALYPRDVREWLWRMRERMGAESRGKKPRAIALLAADSLSPGVKDLLKAENVGYYDRGGSLFLPIPGAFVLVDRPSPKRAAPDRSLFTDRRALVVHALLRQAPQPIAVNRLADQLSLSPATVSETMALLDRMEFTRSQGNGPGKRRALIEPGKLLDAWAAHVVDKQPLRRERYFAASGRDAAKLAEQFEAACVKWKTLHAFTGELAGQRLAPFLSSVQIVRCRVDEDVDLEDPLAEVGVQSVTEGSNLECIRSAPGELVFTERHGDLELASPIQIYLDLLRLPGRAKELSAHLRREKIGF